MGGRRGKFEAIADGKASKLARELYAETPDDEASLGGDAYVDWYGLYYLTDADTPTHYSAAILHEDNDGFVELWACPTRAFAEEEMARLHALESEELS